MTHQFSLVPALMLGTLVSQFIARRMCKESFTRNSSTRTVIKLSTSSRHAISRVGKTTRSPPSRNSPRSWPNPLEADELRQLLEDHSFQRFPYMKDGKLAGIVSREEIEHALDTGRQPRLREAHTCERQQSISEAQFGLIESEDGIIVILDKAGGSPVGVLTLHDLVRAERRVANNQD
jgi:CIC family chloride channel protein